MKLAAFFDAVRVPVFNGRLSKSQVSGCETLLTAFAVAGWPLEWAAYGLATAKWETAHTMQPRAERGGESYFRMMYDPAGSRPALAMANGNTQAGDGARYRGRGYVQLTWRNNYRRAGQKLGQDLEASPWLATVPEIAAAIMVNGMEEGWFTGKKCADYLGARSLDYYNARRIINGLDHAAPIAALARLFADALRAGDYQPSAKPGAARALRPSPTGPVAVGQPEGPPSAPVARPREALPAPAEQPAPPAAAPGFWARFFAALIRRFG